MPVVKTGRPEAILAVSCGEKRSPALGLQRMPLTRFHASTGNSFVMANGRNHKGITSDSAPKGGCTSHAAIRVKEERSFKTR